MIKNIQTLLIIPLYFLFSPTASAVFGASISYECLGTNTYEVTLTAYQDCSGPPLSGFGQVLDWTGPCSPSSGTFNAVFVNKVDVTPVCASANSNCSGGGGLGVDKYTYTGTVTLPTGCVFATLSWEHCCRSAAITTFNSPTADLYVYAEINNTAGVCNNSVEFLSELKIIGDRNDPYFYNNSAFDVDGDSLVYSLVDCQESAGTSVDYDFGGGYSGSNPIDATPSITLDPESGQLEFGTTLPPNHRVVICVLVEEYRGNVKVGAVVRDFEYESKSNGSNQPPVVSAINVIGSYSTTGAVGVPISFFVEGTDLNAADTVTMDWDNNIAGATFSVAPSVVPSAAEGTFSWTPSPSDAGKSHFFRVRIKDNRCPINAVSSYAYRITIPPLPPPSCMVSAVDTTPCEGTDIELSVSVIGGTMPYTYSWEAIGSSGQFPGNFNDPTSANPRIQNADLGMHTYQVTVTDNAGVTTICVSDTIEVMPFGGPKQSAGGYFSKDVAAGGAPSNFSNDAGGDWNNPTQTRVDDGVYTTGTFGTNTTQAWDNFVDAASQEPSSIIPPNSRILGVELRMNGNATIGATMDVRVRRGKNPGNPTPPWSDIRSHTWNNTVDADIFVGGCYDLWGLPDWFVLPHTNSGFTVEISITNGTINIDDIEAIFHYVDGLSNTLPPTLTIPVSNSMNTVPLGGTYTIDPSVGANIASDIFTTNTSGIYTVTYNVTDANGCVGEIVKTTLVTNGSSLICETEGDTVCGGGDLNFSELGSSANTWSWVNPLGNVVGTTPSVSISTATTEDAGTYELFVFDSLTGAGAVCPVDGKVDTFVGVPSVSSSFPSDNARIGGGPPTARWINAANTYIDDNIPAEAQGGHDHAFFDFGLSGIPPTANITGIEVVIKARTSGTNSGISIELEHPTSGLTSTGYQIDYPNDNNYHTRIFGACNDLWGGQWTASDFTTTAFQVIGIHTGGTSVFVDFIEVRIHYADPVTFQLTTTTITQPNVLDITTNSAFTPLGGIFSSPHISGTVFNSASAPLGDNIISYEFADCNGCVGGA